MSANFQLDHETTRPEVAAQIRWLQQHQAALYTSLQSAAPYLYYIYQQTQQRKLPAELALLPIIESGFNPHADSSAGAEGFWQLMPRTASTLGVKVNHAYDGRRDLVASTSAALDYLNYQYKIFHNNWPLAIAAYDCGAGTLLASIHHNHSWSFWQLNLNPETRAYVPKLLALAAVIANPARYHIRLPPIKNTPYLTLIKINKSTNVKKIAKNAGISLATLKHFNPAYLNLAAVGRTAASTLMLPIGKAASFKASLAKVTLADNTSAPTAGQTDTNTDEKSIVAAYVTPTTQSPTATDYYVVKEHDTLGQISAHFHLNIVALENVNHLDNSLIRAGETLIVPLADNDAES